MAQTPLLRKESLERVASPEQLDQYIRVASPRAWMALLATLLLIIAACAFCMVATVPKTQVIELTVRDGAVSADCRELGDGAYRAEVEVGDQRLIDMLLGR